MNTFYGTILSCRLSRDGFGIHYPEILFEKGNKRGIPAVGLDEEGANSVGKFIRGGITGDGEHNIIKRWKDLVSHSISGTTNPGGTRKSDDPLKEIQNTIPWMLDNHLKGIRDLVQNRTRSQ